MSPLKAVVADMDGTLIDSMYLVRHGLYEAVQVYLTEHVELPRPVPSYEDYVAHLHGFIGKPTREMLEQTVRLMYRDAPEHLEGIDFEALAALLDPIQDELASEYVRAFPGAAEFLHWMGGRVNLAIFTGATPYQLVRNLGAAFGELGCSELFLRRDLSEADRLAVLAKAFVQTYGIEGVEFVTSADITISKPHPQGVFLALERLGVTAQEAMVIGDHTADIASGAAAGIEVRVGVMMLGEDPSELKRAGAMAVVTDFRKIPDLLNEAGLV